MAERRAAEGDLLELATRSLGSPEAMRLLADLVRLAPTNLEDPPRGRYEKPNYPRAAARIHEAARSWGLASRILDAGSMGVDATELHGVPRPNVVVDLDVGADERVLVLAHYDVVPVPEEQLARWKSPPHELTARSDGRLYGRGANDDLGSGVVGSLLALRRLRSEGGASRNVRVLICCDEETGGEGGVEAFRHADERAEPSSGAERFLSADVALIPDGSPHTTAASSGLLFVDASIDDVPLPRVLDFANHLIVLNDLASTWSSPYPSEDWPDHGAPTPTIAGRATVTRLDIEAAGAIGSTPSLLAAHAETDATNQVAEAVTLLFRAAPEARPQLADQLGALLSLPFRVAPAAHSALPIRSDTLALQVIGQSAHGGYPHRGHNPVPATVELLRASINRGLLQAAPARARFAIDVRLTPAMRVEEGRGPILAATEAWIRDQVLPARVEAPPSRCRAGYALPLDHPEVARLQRILRETLASPGVFGEYGGTDASALAGLATPSGRPLPAIVFGSMDRQSHIHEAEESVRPELIAGVAETIVRFVREP